jgi:hypothetical protein
MKINKEIIISIFDKANGYGKEYGDWADYNEIDPIRNEFIRLVNAVDLLEKKSFMSIFSNEAIRLIDEEINNEESC